MLRAVNMKELSRTYTGQSRTLQGFYFYFWWYFSRVPVQAPL